jgi:hypothetical protein
VRPIAPQVRAAIVAELHQGRRQTHIARRHGVSAVSVKRIRIRAGLQPRSSDALRVAAARARGVRLLHVSWRQARMVVELLEDAQKLREQLWQPTMVFGFGGSAYRYAEAQLEEPDPEGKLAIIIAVAICIDKSLMLERRDQRADAASGAAIFHVAKIPAKTKARGVRNG